MQQMTENEFVKIFACVSYGYCDTCTYTKPGHGATLRGCGFLAPWLLFRFGFKSQSESESVGRMVRQVTRPIQHALNGCKGGCQLASRAGKNALHCLLSVVCVANL